VAAGGEGTVLRDLFGNPPDGTFLAWFADHGLWALLAAIGAIFVWYLAHRFTTRWITRAIEGLRNNWMFGEFVSGERVIRWADEAVIAVVIGVPATIGILDLLGVDISPALRGGDSAWDEAWPWLRTHGLRIALIVIISYLASRTIARALPRLMTRLILRAEQREAEDPAEAAKRAETLTVALSGLMSVLIWIIALITILPEFNVQVGPLLAGLGLVGVAVGFGSQWLVRDIIAGIFIIGENQYRKGDVVEVAGKAGLVEAINLRRTILRDLDGKVHVISNGEIHVSSNFSKQWSRANIDIQVAYKSDMQHVFDIITEIGLQMAREPYWSDVILDPPRPLRINSFDDSGITVKILAMTKPLKQWDVMGELRWRLKKRFDEEGIEIPFPHRTIYWGDGSNPTTGAVGSTQREQEIRDTARLKARAAAERKAAMTEEAATVAAGSAGEKLKRAFESLSGRGRLTGIARPEGPRITADQRLEDERRQADLLGKLEE
jgi:small conductance mechanosensitive channel